MYVIFLSPKFPFFLHKAMPCSSFFQDRRKISDYRQWSSTQNNSEIASQSVCVTEEDSVCGDRRSYRFGLPQGGYGDQCRQHYWKSWGTSFTKNYEDPGTCLQLTCLHLLFVARYDISLIFSHCMDLLDSYYSMGQDQPSERRGSHSRCLTWSSSSMGGEKLLFYSKQQKIKV